MWWWLTQHVATTSLLVAVVALACRRLASRPALVHAIWLVVLIKFLTPPLVAWPWTVRLAETMPGSHPGVPAGASAQASSELISDTRSSTLSTENSVLSTRSIIVPTDVQPRAEAALDAPSMPHPTPLAGGPPSLEEADLPSQSLRLETFPQAPSDKLAWLAQAALAAWVIGGLIVGLSQGRRIWRHAGVLRQGITAPDHLTQEVRRLAASLGMCPVRVLLVRHVASPCIWCAGRLSLLWPERLGARRDVARYQGVIAHELAHVRRRDHWVAWLELVGGMIWWWNPLFWLVRRRLREASEMACDALALSILPRDRFSYAEALLELSASNKSGALAPLLGISSTHQTFERRFSMILSDHVSGNVSRGGLLAVVVLAVLVLPHWSLGQAAAPASEPQAAAPAAPASPNESATAAEPTAGDGRSGQIAEVAPSGEAKELEARLQQIEATLQIILKRLEAADARPTPRPSSATSLGGGRLFSAELPRLTTLQRNFAVRREQGLLALVAEEPETGKTLWRSELPKLEQEPVKVRLEESPDKKFVEVRVEASGGVGLRLTVEPATGRQVQLSVEGPTRQVTQLPAAAPKAPAASTSTRSVTPAWAPALAPAPVAPPVSTPPAGGASRGSSVAAGPAGMAAQAAPAAQLDLVNLATAYIDAQGAFKLAEARYEQLKSQPEGVVAKAELTAAAIQVETAQNKTHVLKAVVDAAYESAKAEVQYAEELYKKGLVTSSQAVSGRSRIKLLESILGSSSSSISGGSGSGTSSFSTPPKK